MSPGTYGEHRRFCQLDGWESRDTDHYHYTKRLPDGTFLRTKVSHGKSSTQYGRALWGKVLKQLDVTQDEFYDTLKSRKPLQRGPVVAERPPGPAIPLWLYQLLQTKVGMTPEELGALDEKEAIARWIEWQSAPRD